ncbi:C45 family autoproteolytic acyltransferase/hydolase [Paenibacillus dendritiformis]|uniref:C45 family autoproteolytic acyltransferase/hydolase n=1 Tax=Paenibacillus dendritiformis TaxID=130049 RepID=UPI000DA719C5|nr:C45 family peptidase [Paenibacillus dendritiformis]PZM65992.1 choloylglycine hydrolase [Paenibacillus dendritiformis]
MQEKTGYFAHLEGTSREVGRQQGQFAAEQPAWMPMLVLPEPLPEARLRETMRLLDDYCPGINDELLGAAEQLGVEPGRMVYYAGTDIQAGCSHCAVLPGKTADGRTYVLRNYDLSPELADMRLCDTAIHGRYRHIGFSTVLFGRTEGMNEHGLCVTFSACGQPVGNMEGMRAAKVSGLQFWAVVRTVLERCRTAAEAVAAIREMPIASNMNLIIADASGDAALLETFDGEIAVKEADGTAESYVTATNHPLFPEVARLEPRRLHHSVVRHELLNEALGGSAPVGKDELRGLVQQEYPHGLTVHNYRQWFGTLYSMLFDLNERTLDVCFGSPLQNPWYTVRIGERFPLEQVKVRMEHRDPEPGFWQLV